MVKNITLSAPEELIKQARKKAASEKTSLNERFREWLKSYIGSKDFSAEYRKIMKRLDYVNSGGKFTREEMNER